MQACPSHGQDRTNFRYYATVFFLMYLSSKRSGIMVDFIKKCSVFPRNMANIHKQSKIKQGTKTWNGASFIAPTMQRCISSLPHFQQHFYRINADHTTICTGKSCYPQRLYYTYIYRYRKQSMAETNAIGLTYDTILANQVTQYSNKKRNLTRITAVV